VLESRNFYSVKKAQDRNRDGRSTNAAIAFVVRLQAVGGACI
jgi:hypothetical protein